jgi:hypothetical protein
MSTLLVYLTVARSATAIVVRGGHIEHHIVKFLIIVLLDVVIAICLVAPIVIAV